MAGGDFASWQVVQSDFAVGLNGGSKTLAGG